MFLLGVNKFLILEYFLFLLFENLIICRLLIILPVINHLVNNIIFYIIDLYFDEYFQIESI